MTAQGMFVGLKYLSFLKFSSHFKTSTQVLICLHNAQGEGVDKSCRGEMEGGGLCGFCQTRVQISNSGVLSEASVDTC